MCVLHSKTVQTAAVVSVSFFFHLLKHPDSFLSLVWLFCSDCRKTVDVHPVIIRCWLMYRLHNLTHMENSLLPWTLGLGGVMMLRWRCQTDIEWNTWISHASSYLEKWSSLFPNISHVFIQYEIHSSSKTADETQRRNDVSWGVQCTNTSKQFIRWPLKAFCVCSAVCTLILCAAVVYSTSLSSLRRPLFHNKTLLQQRVTLKLNMMLGFYSNGGRGE